MMRYAGLIMVSLYLAAGVSLTVLAAQDKADAQTSRETNTSKSGPQQKKSSARPRKPASSFKPSERIRADSAVSFPVDI